MISNGKVTLSDAEYAALMAHDAKQSAKITEQRARIKQLSDAIDDLFKLVQNKGQPMSHPENQALINAGDTIAVNEGALWNLRWELMAHSPNPAASTSDRCVAKSITDGSRCIGPLGHVGAHGFTVDAAAKDLP
jgi:hypothetical protein